MSDNNIENTEEEMIQEMPESVSATGLEDAAAVDEVDFGEMASREELRLALYAMLFASDRPMSSGRLAEALGEDIDKEIVKNMLAELATELDNMNLPYILREIAGGYQLTTKPQYAKYIRNLFQIRKSKGLSKSALETLAIVAYRQPVTRSDVESIRGVSVSYAFEMLQERRLIKVAGIAELPGRPRLYRTTDEFLLQFGIKSLKELPSIEELRGMD